MQEKFNNRKKHLWEILAVLLASLFIPTLAGLGIFLVSATTFVLLAIRQAKDRKILNGQRYQK